MRLDEAARELGLSTRHILRFVKSGELPAEKVETTITAKRVKVVEYPKKVLVWEISQAAVERLKAKRKEYYEAQPDWIRARAKVNYEEVSTE